MLVLSDLKYEFVSLEENQYEIDEFEVGEKEVEVIELEWEVWILMNTYVEQVEQQVNEKDQEVEKTNDYDHSIHHYPIDDHEMVEVVMVSDAWDLLIVLDRIKSVLELTVAVDVHFSRVMLIDVTMLLANEVDFH